MHNWQHHKVESGVASSERCTTKPSKRKKKGVTSGSGGKPAILGMKSAKIWSEAEVSKKRIGELLQSAISGLLKSRLSRRNLRSAIIDMCIRHGHTRQQAMSIVDRYVRDDVPRPWAITKPIWQKVPEGSNEF
jgi:hypothetical protein